MSSSDIEGFEQSELTTSEMANFVADDNDKTCLISQLACHFCGMQFDIRRTRSLRSHIEEVHVVGDSDFMCGICCEEFSSRKAVESHMSLLHRTSKPMGCGTCGETFKVRNLLLKHIESHSKEQLDDNKVGLCYCGECFEFFDSVTTLQAHVMNHREQAVFVCGACGLQSEHRHVMVKHLETHVILNLLSAEEGSEIDQNHVNMTLSEDSGSVAGNTNIPSNLWIPHVEIDAGRIQSESENITLHQGIDELTTGNTTNTTDDQICAHDFDNVSEEASYKCGVCDACFTSLAEAVAHAGYHQDEHGDMQQVEINVFMDEKTGDIAPTVIDEHLVQDISGLESSVKIELLHNHNADTPGESIDD